MRQVVLYQDEDGVWIAEVPSLPGCRSDGDSRDEALSNIREAIAHMIEFMRGRGEPVPTDPGTAEVAVIEADAA